MLGWTSDFFRCKAKGLKRSKTATSNFFRTLKFFEIGHQYWRFGEFWSILKRFCANLVQILEHFEQFLWLSKIFRVRKKIEVAVFERFRPLALQQKRPEVHPSNIFFFSKPWFCYLYGGRSAWHLRKRTFKSVQYIVFFEQNVISSSTWRSKPWICLTFEKADL